ncbi:hypothetical protein B7R54_06855 [Subtercola boreus]|uniref:Uncharacterized protein n=1 Tax=Subtercola boreus TaxID=120213 RepID=A0A3E0VGX3_9MICO|nr:hypothetical protein [Subtercola boreus]RFA08971.1 hypothetical protein B7R54_06855 [Subtercola boreus]TQL54037.1 hypothetical protein FB464_1563 [Subtercola boreus]
MSTDKPPSVLENVLTGVYVAFAVALLVAGIVQLVNGNSIGWLLILFAPVTGLLGFVRITQLRQRREKRLIAEKPQ